MAIRDAALAYTLVQQREALKKQYWQLRCTLGGQLSEEMEANLRRHGIEPDDLDNDRSEDSCPSPVEKEKGGGSL